MLRFGHEDIARSETLTYAPALRNASKHACVSPGLGACRCRRPPHCRWPKSDSYKWEEALRDGYLWAVKWVKVIFCGIWVQSLSMPFFILTRVGHFKKTHTFQGPHREKGEGETEQRWQPSTKSEMPPLNRSLRRAPSITSSHCYFLPSSGVIDFLQVISPQCFGSLYSAFCCWGAAMLLVIWNPIKACRGSHWAIYLAAASLMWCVA